MIILKVTQKHGFTLALGDTLFEKPHGGSNKGIFKWKLWRHHFFPWRQQQIFLRDWNYIVDVVMWPNFGNSSISMRQVLIISIF